MKPHAEIEKLINKTLSDLAILFEDHSSAFSDAEESTKKAMEKLWGNVYKYLYQIESISRKTQVDKDTIKIR